MGNETTTKVAADAAEGQPAGEAPSTRQRILQIALTLMSQRGVDGTSMRDLASACDLNVASLYHYFPSKRELLEAVLVENGFYPVKARGPRPEDDPTDDKLVALLANVLTSMFQVEEFVRLMVGEAIRGEETARSVGADLFSNFEVVIEDWIRKNRPDLDERSGAAPIARLLTGVIVGLFVQHAAGVVEFEGDNQDDLIRQRAREIAQILRVMGDPTAP
ncbi:MAG TPA: TetR/AcrR family transcriptional regulator [Acidimicrobiales bacterium]|jgi:AcrR family transcriptional regulator